MTSNAPGWRELGVRIVRHDQLDPNTAQTPGMLREAAVSSASVGADKILAGTVTIQPGAKTGPHHHGELESVTRDQGCVAGSTHIPIAQLRGRAGELDPASTCAQVVAGGGCGSTMPADDQEAPALNPEEACLAALDAGLLVRRAHPLNCEMPLPALTGGAVMPNARFYVRNHFGIPDVDPTSWRLHVGGLVERRLALDLAQLRAMPSASAVVTLDCAGNGRAGFQPPTPGEQWGVGAVSTAEWTGVPLTEVLDRAGARAAAREVVFRRADRGQVDGHEGRVQFERSLPIELLGQAGALLAYAMNGEELPDHHGFPVRLVVPGWYAVASVKWLSEIELIGRPFRGHFQADRYHIYGEPVSLQRVRSLIVEPAPGATVETGDLVIRGVAWSGAAPIARVEVRIDTAPWQPATLIGERRRHSWQWWELPARLARPGCITIRARATDLAGRTQPDRPQWNPLGYSNNAIHEVHLAARTASSRQRPQEPPDGRVVTERADPHGVGELTSQTSTNGRSGCDRSSADHWR